MILHHFVGMFSNERELANLRLAFKPEDGWHESMTTSHATVGDMTISAKIFWRELKLDLVQKGGKTDPNLPPS